MVYLPEVTHPSINWAWRRVTSLITTNALPLSQTTNPKVCTHPTCNLFTVRAQIKLWIWPWTQIHRVLIFSYQAYNNHWTYKPVCHGVLSPAIYHEWVMQHHVGSSAGSLRHQYVVDTWGHRHQLPNQCNTWCLQATPESWNLLLYIVKINRQAKNPTNHLDNENSYVLYKWTEKFQQ